MRGMRKLSTMAGLLILALLPVVGAAVSSEGVRLKPRPGYEATPYAASPPLNVTVAPLAVLKAPWSVPLRTPLTSPTIHPESGLIALIGAGLIGLGAIVRKTTT